MHATHRWQRVVSAMQQALTPLTAAPARSRCHRLFATVPSVQPLPWSYQSSLASHQSAAPLTDPGRCFALLHRLPIHAVARESEQYQGRPFQFLLRLCHPCAGGPSGNVSGDPYIVHEWVFFSNITIADLSAAIQQRIPRTAITISANGSVLAGSETFNKLFSKKNIRLLVNGNASESVLVNGGMTLTSGVQSYTRRNIVTLLSAAMGIVAILAAFIEDKPTDTKSDTSADPAHQHWHQRQADETASFETFLDESMKKK